MKLFKIDALKFHTSVVVVVGPHAISKKGYTSVPFVRTSVYSRLTFTRESLTFSRKIRPVVVVVELFVLFARDRGTKDEKRASSSRSRALFKKWNYS